jgi:colanic acid biosynthesis glycosyl transferase WcaI
VKFAIVSQYYPPETGAPQARLSELAGRMASSGHTVTVLTAMPNYPTGNIYPGYGGLLRSERIGDVSVIRSAIYPTQSAARVPRLLSYLSFSTSSLLAGAARLGSQDCLMVESPPLFLGPTGYWLSRVKRARFIFNVSDLWPDTAVRLGLLDPKSRAYQVSAAIEAYCYRNAWLVTGQSRSIVADIQRRFPSVATYHLSNGADTRRFRDGRRCAEVRRQLMNSDEGVLAVYVGLHGLAQGLDQVIDAAAALPDSGVHFALVGDGPEKAGLQRQAQQTGLQNLKFFPSVPFTEVPNLLASSDIVIVALKTDIPGAVPSKLYEAMASEKPVVLVATGEAADVVRDHGAGIVVRPDDRAGLAEAIRRLKADPSLRDEMGRRGRLAVEKHFDRDTISAGFVRFVEDKLSKAARADSR